MKIRSLGLTLGGLSSLLLGQEPELPPGLGSVAEPSLPAGLEETGEPSLPEGLQEGEPALPSGLGDTPERPSALTTQAQTSWADQVTWRGFAEMRVGAWLQDNPVDPDLPIAEARVQVDANTTLRAVDLRATLDFLADPLAPTQAVDLRRGEGWLDVRELSAHFQPLNGLDVQLGRQVSTWGTGDFLFINDLFPKDWRAFFLGRDDVYLKAPADALRVAYYNPLANVDLVYTPRFTPDRYISGERLSYYADPLGRIAGEDAEVRAPLPGQGELAVRIHRLLGDAEVAAYGYVGAWKSPAGQNVFGEATFPDLRVVGASWRQPLGGGIAKAEFGYYDSSDDHEGHDPWVRNSEFRYLIGYEHELAKELTGSLQWYVEHMVDYGAYRRSLPSGAAARDEDRHVLTVQLTKLALNQNLRLGLFAFYSPTDEDAYLRPSIRYQLDDHWQISGGANIFLGRDEDSFFGQFVENRNIYVAVRYGY